MKSAVLGLLACALTGVSGYATAQTLVGTTTDPTGINGLVVDGTTYNVTFSTTTFHSPFTQGSAASTAAALAMANALTSLGVTELAGVAPGPCPPMSNDCQFNSVLFVAVDNAPGTNDSALCAFEFNPCAEPRWDSFQVEISNDGLGSHPSLGPLPGGDGPVFGYGYAANFTAVGVPESATLGLMFLGLTGVGLMACRRKN